MAVSASIDTNPDDRWRSWAACARSGPATFYGPDRNSPTTVSATAICASCVAAEPCLWAALALVEDAVGYRYGIWGGTTPARRERIADGLAGWLGRLDCQAWYREVAAAWTPPAGRRVRVAA